jgi:Zn-dependent protease with chaperone function
MRFREYSLIQQAAIAAAFVLLIYIPYSYFLLRLSFTESIVMAAYSAVLFMAIYYLTSWFILKKTKKLAVQYHGPKKGLRK